MLLLDFHGLGNLYMLNLGNLENPIANREVICRFLSNSASKTIPALLGDSS